MVLPVRRIDVGALGLAAAITAAMLAPFLARVSRVRLAEDRIPQVVFVPSVPAVQPAPGPAISPSTAELPRPPSTARKRSSVPALAEGAPIAPPSQDPVPPLRGESEIVVGPASAASAPLQVDLQVLREAARASKGAVRQMAESSGTYLGDPAVSRGEQLARAVARTEKPDCLRSGSSLLSAFIVAYELLREQCK
jgi:hypothetical protein